MKITKLGHSCVLVETPDRIGLFDPGVWSDQLLIDKVIHVDRIIITHQHPDHFDIEKIKILVSKFPNVHIICNNEIKKLINEAGINVIIREESDCARKFQAPHEQLPIPGSSAPTQNGYHFKDLFTSAGDSHTFYETKKVLAIAFIAPWGKTGDAINKVLELKPEYVLPIHDWHYHKEAQEWLQKLIESSLAPQGIKVLPAKSGIEHEIS